MSAWPRSGRKYGEKRVEYAGFSFSSKLEREVFCQLQLRQYAGEIKEIQPQVHVKVCGPEGHECKHSEKVELVVDFKCTLVDGSVLYVEAKGFETPEYRIKRRLWIHNKIGKLEIWKGYHTRPILHEVIE